MTQNADDKTKLDTNVVFDKQRAVAAVEAFNAGQTSPLAIAGHLPSALKRIEDLEAVGRACLRIIEDSRHQPALTLKALEVCLRGAQFSEKTPAAKIASTVGSRIDQRRLRDGANALAASSTPPETATEVRAQLSIVGEGIAALQSLDDLGEEANAQAERDQQELWKRHESLTKLLKELEAKESSALPSGR